MEREFTCAEFEIALADWIDGTAGAGNDAFVSHLESCPECARLAEDARFAVGFMERAAEMELPPVLMTKILAATSGWESGLRARGFSGWINRVFAPVLEPRVVMGAVMTLMTLAMIARGFSPGDFAPARLWSAVDYRTHRIWDRAVKDYETTPLVYEVMDRIDGSSIGSSIIGGGSSN